MGTQIDEGPLPPRFAGARTGTAKPEPQTLAITIEVGEILGTLIERLTAPRATPANVAAASKAALILPDDAVVAEQTYDTDGGCGHRELLVTAEEVCTMVVRNEGVRLSHRTLEDLTLVALRLRTAVKALDSP